MKYKQHKFKKNIGVGVDFGTSNTSVAIFDGKNISMLPIDKYAEDTTVMPTAIYVDRGFNFTFGTEGINAYIRDNTGRPIRLAKQKLRDIEVTYGESDTFRGREDEGYDTTIIVEVHAMIDQEMKGHLFRHLKKALSIRGRERIPIFEKKFTIVALITTFLTNLREKIESYLKMPIESVDIGRPVHYSENEDGDRIAIEQMKEACINVGFKNVTFFYEPLGASFSYTKGSYPIGKKLLVFDFGGGTLDISITETGKKGGKVLSVSGVSVGGSLFDRIVYSKKIPPLLGKGIFIKEMDRKHLFPFVMYEENLLNWQQTYLLNTPNKIETILRSIKFLEKYNKQDAEKLIRLYTVITEKLSKRI